MRGLGLRSITMGKVGYTAACVAATVTLVTSGIAYEGTSLVHNISEGASIGNSSSVGEMNILLMGLESRTNFEGQTLSSQQLTETHSGKVSSVASGQVGSQDTDTLILLHIFAGGQKAVGFSIPRDDLVTYPHATYDGISEGKIDQAYAYAYDQSLESTVNTSMSSSQRYLEANQAGQLFEIQTVESITGVHINHFVVSNIIGFFTLAQAFGGVEVCIKPAPPQGRLAFGANLSDWDPLTHTDNSGFNALQDGYNWHKGGAQYLHLSPAQSLAFVRSRDTLPGVDIGRTARQQAVLDYVIYQLKHANYFTDIGKLTALLTGASSYLIADSGFNLLDFATNMQALTSKNMHFTTLPATPQNNVPVPGFPSGEDVNIINVPKIQHEVHSAFYPASAPDPSVAAPASSITVDVYNSSGAPNLASDVSQAFAARGYKTGAVADSSSQSRTATADTQIFYGSGADANATVIANEMGATTAPVALSSLAAGHVEVLLGSQVTAVPSGIEPGSPGTSGSGAGGSGTSGSGTSGSGGSGGSGAGTASVSATMIGATSAARGAASSAASRSALSSAASASVSASAASRSAVSAAETVTVPPNAPYGIPCVY